MATSSADRILLFQLSDLHFGSTFEGSFVASSVYTGLNGHSLELAQALPVALRGALRREFKVGDNDTVEYLVSGDLTRNGSTGDFQLVYTYLYSELQWLHDRYGTPASMGLKLPLDKVHQVPGNHDHWDGSWLWPQPTYNGNLFPDVMDPTLVAAADQAHRTFISPHGKLAFELFRVDSNEGLGVGRSFRAAGQLSPAQLYGEKDANGVVIKNGLEQQMDAAAAQGIIDGVPRVAGIACHHSLGNKYTNLSRAMPLEPYSVGNLLKLIRGYKKNFAVRAVLTGHTHYPLPWAMPNPKDPDRIWELRASSTLQMDPQPAAQGFWVHEITLDDAGQPKWDAWRYNWNGTSFVRESTPCPIR